MNAEKLLDVFGEEKMHSDQSCKLNERRMIKESLNVVDNGAGSKGLFSCKSSKRKNTKCKINKSLRGVHNGAGSKGLFCVNID